MSALDPIEPVRIAPPPVVAGRRVRRPERDDEREDGARRDAEERDERDDRDRGDGEPHVDVRA